MERYSKACNENNRGYELPSLGPWDEVCGTLEDIKRSDNRLHLTFTFHQTVAIEFSSEIFRQLVNSQGKKVGLLCIGNNQYRIRKVKEAIAEA